MHMALERPHEHHPQPSSSAIILISRFSIKNIGISRYEIIIRTYQEYHLHQYSFFSTVPTPPVHPIRSTISTAAALHLPHHPYYHGDNHQNPSFVSSMLLLLIS